MVTIRTPSYMVYDKMSAGQVERILALSVMGQVYFPLNNVIDIGNQLSIFT